MKNEFQNHNPDREPLPGIPFDKRVCVCTECGRLVTAESSVARGCGPTCFAKHHQASMYLKLEQAGQLRMWPGEAS